MFISACGVTWPKPDENKHHKDCLSDHQPISWIFKLHLTPSTNRMCMLMVELEHLIVIKWITLGCFTSCSSDRQLEQSNEETSVCSTLSWRSTRLYVWTNAVHSRYLSFRSVVPSIMQPVDHTDSVTDHISPIPTLAQNLKASSSSIKPLLWHMAWGHP